MRRVYWEYMSDTIVLDPSIVLTRWGTTAARRLSKRGNTIFIAPTLRELLLTDGPQAPHVTALFNSILGLDYDEVIFALKAWRRLLTSPAGESVLSELGSTPPGVGNESATYNAVNEWLATNHKTSNHVELVAAEQVALSAALAEREAFVLARCASPPWFWMHLQKKGFVPCKELTEEQWLHDEVAHKKNWLRTNGLHEMAWAGVTFGFVHWVFPEPGTIIKETTGAALAAAKAIYFDP
jgi:hypothetical protein